MTEGELFFRLDSTTIDGAYTAGLVRRPEIDPGIIKVLLEARQENDPEIPKALCRAGKLPGPPDVQVVGFIVDEGRIVFDPKAFEKRGQEPVDADLGTIFATEDSACNQADVRLQIEHLVMINRAEFGLHHPGNVVPICKECNKRQKHQGGKYFTSDEQLLKICKEKNEELY